MQTHLSVTLYVHWLSHCQNSGLYDEQLRITEWQKKLKGYGRKQLWCNGSKGKGHLMTCLCGQAQRGSQGIRAAHSHPRRYKEVGDKQHAQAALTPGKTRYTLYRLGWHRGRSGRHGKSRPPPEFDPQTVQRVAI